jgi:small-conductance mechanosensitive channel
MAKALVNKIQERLKLLKEDQMKISNQIQLFSQEQNKAVAKLNAIVGAISELEEMIKDEEAEPKAN